ncbi:hypothetical protein MGG_16453 [Pyricularia oryzae 70-15]|uniref:Uncharacterized protein n=1 Tax=Pyricularia oryzae (strain 70-15 / ATCC MYA-4617 / FGSC 8958) TaxID=242507 RepID=G4MPH3_PYRO7|nr:uncharacterized protein MGG_16453 [Pyricularia oryzae 70-15]EHA58016.1 hypothetical protein MGG_16453 [Pyricularia oryzae 70-15]
MDAGNDINRLCANIILFRGPNSATPTFWATMSSALILGAVRKIASKGGL